MNKCRRYVVRGMLIVLMLNSSMPAQAIDWSYWSGYAREKISGFVASIPSKNQVIDCLKQPKVWGALAVVSAIAGALYYMKQQSEGYKEKSEKSVLGVKSMPSPDNARSQMPMSASRIKAHLRRNLEQLLRSVPADAIQTFYLATYDRPTLSLPKDIQSVTREQLESLFLSYGLEIGSDVFWSNPSQWCNKQWQDAVDYLNEPEFADEQFENMIKEWKVTKRENPNLFYRITRYGEREKVCITAIPMLKKQMQLLFETFLPPENLNLKNYIIKERPEDRLCTYVKIYSTIKKKELQHILLPCKFLILQDKETKEFITDPEIIKNILQESVHIFVSQPAMIQCCFSLVHPAYTFHIAAEKIERHGTLSLAALKDLRTLFEDTPFDVGDDNIFVNAIGNAIIIDTEYKGTKKEEADKLEQYYSCSHVD